VIYQIKLFVVIRGVSEHIMHCI